MSPVKEGVGTSYIREQGRTLDVRGGEVRREDPEQRGKRICKTIGSENLDQPKPTGCPRHVTS